MNLTYNEFVSLMHDDAIVKGIPVHGTFSLTPRCNLHCRMCFVCNPLVADEELSGGQWLDIMKQARDAGMTFCLLTGGEPLLHKDFWEIYTGLRKLGVYTTLNSNGTTITPEIADRLKSMPPVRMAISVYGSSPEAYEKVTGSSAGYEKMVNGLKLLRERGIDFRLRTILTRDTAPDMENLVRFILSYDVPFSYGNFIMPPVVENRNNPQSLRLSGQEIAKYMDKIINAMQEYYDTYGNANADKIEKMRKEDKEQAEKPKDPKREELRKLARGIAASRTFNCFAGLTEFSVTYNGFIRICETARDPLFDLKQMSFKEGHKRLGEAMAAIPDCTDCKKCPDKIRCAPCPPRHFAQTGSYDIKDDYVCEYIKAGVKLIE